MTKIPLNHSDYEKHYNEQIEFLKNSCNSFDNGFDGESKRIALTLRVLLHDTKQSHSLLGLMNKKVIDFISTNAKFEPSSSFSFNGLAMMASTANGYKYTAMLDNAEFNYFISFENWWNEIIFIDNENKTITRKELVLTAANQDGGAHIDSSLERTYARISKENSLGVSTEYENKSIPLQNAERASLRQIGHEVLKTLEPNYKKTPKDDGVDYYIGNFATVSNSSMSSVRSNKKIGRNEKCHCGSGIKYKKCHGKLNSNL
ncbi:MAG TPA: SEC-C domain-containing protein [Lutibacter sp.]